MLSRLRFSCASGRCLMCAGNQRRSRLNQDQSRCHQSRAAAEGCNSSRPRLKTLCRFPLASAVSSALIFNGHVMLGEMLNSNLPHLSLWFASFSTPLLVVLAEAVISDRPSFYCYSRKHVKLFGFNFTLEGKPRSLAKHCSGVLLCQTWCLYSICQAANVMRRNEKSVFCVI